MPCLIGNGRYSRIFNTPRFFDSLLPCLSRSAASSPSPTCYAEEKVLQMSLPGLCASGGGLHSGLVPGRRVQPRQAHLAEFTSRKHIYKTIVHNSPLPFRGN